MSEKCSRCGQPISVWERDFAAGVCSKCRRAEEEMGRWERDAPAPDAAEGQPQATPTLTIDQLIFVGLRGYALALDRDTGEIVWSNNKLHSGYVTLLLDGDRLIVSTNGYMYALDPLTGLILWHNPLTGYGTAPTSVISVRGQSSQTLVQQAAADEESRRQASHGGAM